MCVWDFQFHCSRTVEVDTVASLLRSGINASSRDTLLLEGDEIAQSHRTALHYAALWGMTPVVEVHRGSFCPVSSRETLKDVSTFKDTSGRSYEWLGRFCASCGCSIVCTFGETPYF